MMTPFEVATLATNVAIGLGQIGIVWYGIRAMTRSASDRSDEHDKRHAEAMTSHDKRHAEAMTSHDQRHAEAMAALDIQRQALETLIARTGRAQPAS